MAKTKEQVKTEYGVIYARYSSHGQRDESIEGQLRDCYAFAERNGITIIGEYCDRALTGTSDKRPEFQRMIKDSAKGQFQVVITWKNDRFARSRYDSAVYKFKLKQNGVRILYAKESIPNGPEGIILESVMEGFAEYYSANLSQNVKRGNYDSALKHQTLGVKVLGYKTGADKKYEIDENTAPIVRKIFADYAAGKPSKQIVEEINTFGYRTTSGKPFQLSSIRYILENEKYIGVYAHKDIRDENGIPPIIDIDTFEKVQAMLKYRHKAPAAKKIDGGYLLTSKIFCGECGQPMNSDGGTSSTGKVYNYYTCTARKKHLCKKERVEKNWIENVVIDALSQIIDSDETINSLADVFMEWQSKQDTSDKIKVLEKELKQTETAIQNTMDVIDSGFVTESLKSHLMELETQRKAREKALSEALLEQPEIDRDVVVWFLQRFRKGDRKDIVWKITLIDMFLKAVYVYDDRIHLDLNYTGDDSKNSLEILEKAATDGTKVRHDNSSKLKLSGVPKQKPCLSTGFLFCILHFSFFTIKYSFIRQDFCNEVASLLKYFDFYDIMPQVM